MIILEGGASTLEGGDSMYFCGWTTEQILEKELPIKLIEQGINVSFIFAIYAMLELRNNDSAMLVYGYMKDNFGPCAWVEYNDANGKRMVRDYCAKWQEIPYLAFHNRYYPDTERIYLDYIFWTKFTKKLYELAQKPETSYILSGIGVLNPKFENGRVCGITEFNHYNPIVIDGSKFTPTVIINPDKSLALLTQEFLESLMQ